jgi:hypothetical protein
LRPIDPATGLPYTPMSNADRLKAMEGRQWDGDAAEAMFSPCMRCGGPCGRSAKYVQPWRVHSRCTATTCAGRVVAAVRELLGEEIAYADAGLIAAQVSVPSYRDLPDAQPHAEPGRAWGHVNKRQLRKAVQSLPRLRAQHGLTPRPCASGPCCWCGLRLSTGWVNEGHKWADGSKAPLCGVCSAAWVRHGGLSGRLSRTFYSDQRAAGWSAMVGSDLPMGHLPPPEFRLWAEVAPAGHPGHNVPFGYVAAAQRPGTVEHAQRVEREDSEALALADQRRAEQAAAEREQRQRWGYEVAR